MTSPEKPGGDAVDERVRDGVPVHAARDALEEAQDALRHGTPPLRHHAAALDTRAAAQRLLVLDAVGRGRLSA